MKLVCKWCGKKMTRDMRFKYIRGGMTKRGYKSYCEEFKRDTFLQKVK